MKTNEGTPDRLLRGGAALALAAMVAAVPMAPGLYYSLIGVAAILGLTALVGFCPLYALLGINTRPVKPKTP